MTKQEFLGAIRARNACRKGIRWVESRPEDSTFAGIWEDIPTLEWRTWLLFNFLPRARAAGILLSVIQPLVLSAYQEQNRTSGKQEEVWEMVFRSLDATEAWSRGLCDIEEAAAAAQAAACAAAEALKAVRSSLCSRTSSSSSSLCSSSLCSSSSSGSDDEGIVPAAAEAEALASASNIACAAFTGLDYAAQAYGYYALLASAMFAMAGGIDRHVLNRAVGKAASVVEMEEALGPWTSLAWKGR